VQEAETPKVLFVGGHRILVLCLVNVLFHRTSKNMHQNHFIEFIQQIDFENYSCMSWKGFPAARRKSLIKKLKRKYSSNVDRVFTENVNAGLANFKIKKCIKPSEKSINRRFKILSSVLSTTTVKFNNAGLIYNYISKY
jgi:hypothetical protein